MFIIDWYRQWKEAKREFSEPKVCDTCEALKLQVEQLRHDNNKLMDRLLEKPAVPTQPVVDNMTPIIPKGRQLPWKARQQLLEENDRHQAKLLRDAPKPQPVAVTTTNQELEDELFEQELKDAERQREAKSR